MGSQDKEPSDDNQKRLQSKSSGRLGEREIRHAGRPGDRLARRGAARSQAPSASPIKLPSTEVTEATYFFVGVVIVVALVVVVVVVVAGVVLALSQLSLGPLLFFFFVNSARGPTPGFLPLLLLLKERTHFLLSRKH